MDTKNDYHEAKIINSGKDKGLGFQAHILLVDDEEFLVKLWKHVMEKRGYRVTSYTEGLLALDEFKSDPFSFDILITDQSMPEITGCELAAEILKIRSDMKIIICSGYLGEMDKENALSKRICEFLIKPFHINTLIETIERNL
jgi:DNA-binding NtrC family response regulator